MHRFKTFQAVQAVQSPFFIFPRVAGEEEMGANSSYKIRSAAYGFLQQGV